MPGIKLSLRLSAVLEQCLPELPLWDLCCDHGYLGEAAWRSGRFAYVGFNDAVEHVVEALRVRLAEGLALGTCRLVGGLAEDLPCVLNGNVVMAGIGGEKSFRITITLINKGYLQAERLIFCPEKDAEWFAAQTIPGYHLNYSQRIPHNHGERWIYRFDRITRLADPKS